MRSLGMSKIAWILFCCAVVFSNHLLFSGDVEVFVVNPLEKVFRDSKLVKGQGEVIELAGASNEFESAQFVIRAAEKFQI